ncbi:MAG: tetraacyldisaccharide 4'-kinase [Oceanobacter sp.]
MSGDPKQNTRKGLAAAIERNWYRAFFWNLWLAPLAVLFGLVVMLRRIWFSLFPAASEQLPVIVVGNVTIGGTGKTPLIIWLVEQARKLNIRVGVVSRGYGGKSEQYPLWVTADTPESESGDEPRLIALRTGCPVVVDPVRKNAVAALVGSVDLVLSDDGLQHYAMARAAEIVVIDGERRLGNRWMLPVGPMREPASRLDQADLVITNGKDFILQPSSPINASTGKVVDLLEFEGQKVHGVAGIGHPERFFSALEKLGMEVIRHPFPDHHPYQKSDLDFEDELPVFMTEKDWVKCQAFANENHWYLPVDAVPIRSARQALESLLLTWGEQSNG